MDEDRRAPRRLLSFDAAQNPWSRFGKVFSQRPSGKSPAEDTYESLKNYTCEYTSQSPILSMSASVDKRLAAILGSQSLEIVELVGSEPHQIKSIVIDPKLIPTTLEWGQQATKSQIAVACTSGKILIYNLHGQMIATSTQETLRPPISSLSFSAMASGNVLAGAFSDGAVRLWDLRQGLRRPVSTFSRQGDIARQVQFRPDLETKFATIYDSGMVHRWDIRKHNSPDTRLNAHIQGLTLNWHPSANYLATGGRDHMVNVWNFNTDSKSPEFTINTASAVGRVRWMPGGDSSVASNAIVTSGRSAAASNTRSVNYWLLKSPWVPIYSLESHTDSIVDLAVASPNILWSASKDHKLVQHDLRYEPLVYDNIPPATCEWISAHSVAITTRDVSSLSNTQHHQHTYSQSHSQQGGQGGNPNTTATSSITPSQTPMEEDTPSAEPKSLAQTGKTPTSLSFLGSSFNLQPSPSPTSSSAVTPTGSYFTMSHHSSPSTPGAPAQKQQDSSNNLALALNRMFDERNFSPVVELDFLPSNSGLLDARVNQYLFEPLPNQSLAEACLYNAQLETPLHTNNLWEMLAVAVDDIENGFLNQLTSKAQQELALAWFRGEIQDDVVEPAEAQFTGASLYPQGTDNSEEPTSFGIQDTYDWGKSDKTWQLSGVSFTSEVSEDDTRVNSAGGAGGGADGGVSGSASAAASSSSVHLARSPKSPRRRRPSTFLKALSAPSMPEFGASNQFAMIKQNFLDFVAAQSTPWSFLKMLRGLIEQSVEDGLIYTTTALVLIFKRFREIIDLPGTDETVVSCIQIMRSQRLFVPAAHIMSISSIWKEQMGSPETTLDVACHHCNSSLSENVTFFKNNLVSGYWYCGRCKQPQSGCSLCNIAVKGLGIVMPCGHRTHPECWKQWVKMGMEDCPAGCGEKI